MFHDNSAVAKKKKNMKKKNEKGKTERDEPKK